MSAEKKISVTILMSTKHANIRNPKSAIRNQKSWGAWIRTREWRLQRPLPYRLATPQCSCQLSVARCQSKHTLAHHNLSRHPDSTLVTYNRTLATSHWQPATSYEKREIHTEGRLFSGHRGARLKEVRNVPGLSPGMPFPYIVGGSGHASKFGAQRYGFWGLRQNGEVVNG